MKGKFSFRDTANKMQILKFKSVDSYAYGETQLIYFVEIREYLRQRAKDAKKPLELVLISLSDEALSDKAAGASKGAGLMRQPTQYGANNQQTSHQQFPPLIENKVGQPGQNTGRNSESEKINRK